ncbi:hypothetical protein [Candidatus Methanodesulfokora washburnensis]|uniref:Uncharacterized protein n=1 Tax=Candidatus Methanodesulfokora washburnensis TaxID=2478471 RepID=A0A429GJE9_9CREN|nr:hypothetical protein [Candidatus Methanodesulfokores washburnensis]RSN74000.1 hypothetical protein D6D85_09100 [Candidatus Methanodesulfokores washburnensis]
MEHVFAFLVCMFIVVVFGLFSIFAVRSMYASQSSFLQEEAVLAFRQLLESPLNETKIPPTIGIAMYKRDGRTIAVHPYMVNMTAVWQLKKSVLKNEDSYRANKIGLVSREDDFRIILYNGTTYIILGKNITRSKVASVRGYAFCPPKSDPFCPSNGNITVKVVVTGD